MNDMPPFSRPIRAADVPPGGEHVEIVADDGERAALARDFGLPGIDRFTAAFDLARTRAGGLAVSGRLDADVRQTCVVTLDPFEAHIAEGIDMVFLPEDAPGAEDAVDEDVDVLVDGRVDLGAVASEFLALALDPHPRKPGAVFEAVTDRESGPVSPFSALAAVVSGNKPADPAAEK